MADSPDPQTRASSAQLVEIAFAPHWAQSRSRLWDFRSPVVIYWLPWFGVVEASANDLARPKLQLDPLVGRATVTWRSPPTGPPKALLEPYDDLGWQAREGPNHVRSRSVPATWTALGCRVRVTPKIKVGAPRESLAGNRGPHAVAVPCGLGPHPPSRPTSPA